MKVVWIVAALFVAGCSPTNAPSAQSPRQSAPAAQTTQQPAPLIEHNEM